SCVYGDGCLFPCRCNSGTTCDSNSGSCSDSKCPDGYPRPTDNQDRYNWAGPACQIGNVAYGKPTNQSGTYKEYVSSRGVDGILGNPNNNNKDCAHPKNTLKKAAWFYVDLGSVHQIFNVTVYNTYNGGGYDRMRRISIRVGNTSDLNEQVECNFHHGVVAAGGSFNSDCQTSGRYVSFRRTDGKQVHLTMPLSMEPGKQITRVPAALSVEAPRLQQLLLTDSATRLVFLEDTGAQERLYPPPNSTLRPLSILSKQDQNLQVLLAPAIAMTPTLEEWGRSVNTAMIAGVTVGLLVIIAVICVAGIMFIRRRNPSSFSKENSEPQIMDEGGERIEAGVQRSFKSKPKVEAREPVKTEDEGTKLSLRQLEKYITKTNDVPDGFKDEYK
ncbi:hypothetical protein CAPTEDRAFT_209120, partial [Capitella teleta]